MRKWNQTRNQTGAELKAWLGVVLVRVPPENRRT